MIPIAISGACGRMGGQVLRRAAEDKELKVVAAIESKNSPSVGKDVGEVLGIKKLGVRVVSSEYLSVELKRSKPRFLVDFTAPDACVNNVKTATAGKVGIIVGTTGLSAAQIREIENAVTKAGVVGLISPNFSVCVNLLFNLAAEAAKTLNGYDMEIVEAHHRFKKDAPSGTAMKLAEVMADALNRDLDKVAVYGRKGIVGQRRTEEIGVHSIRAGDIVGDHTVIFGTIGERLEIKHQAHSRDALAYGALRAVKWLDKQKPGMYGMNDVLGLKH